MKKEENKGIEKQVKKRERKTKVKKRGASRKKQKLNAKQIEDLIINLYKRGHIPDKIGLILRDSYGIASVKSITGKKIVKILREKGFNVFPSDLGALIEKVKNLRKHFEKNKKDYTAKRALQILEARVRILTNYYKKKGVLPQNFVVKF